MPAGPLTLFRRLPRPVRLLVVGSFVNRAGAFIIPFLTLVLRRQFGLDYDAVGLLWGPTASARSSRSWWAGC